MSGETEPDLVLRKSLDAIDSLRRRVMLAGYLTVAGTFGAFLWLTYLSRTNADIKKLLMAAVLALVCVIAWSTFALAIFIVRMTKRILRAIDLASNK